MLTKLLLRGQKKRIMKKTDITLGIVVIAILSMMTGWAIAKGLWQSTAIPIGAVIGICFAIISGTKEGTKSPIEDLKIHSATTVPDENGLYYSYDKEGNIILTSTDGVHWTKREN